MQTGQRAQIARAAPVEAPVLGRTPLLVTTTGLFVVAGLAVLFVSQFEKSALDRSIQAIREDENLARSMGIEVVHLSLCARWSVRSVGDH